MQILPTTTDGTPEQLLRNHMVCRHLTSLGYRVITCLLLCSGCDNGRRISQYSEVIVTTPDARYIEILSDGSGKVGVGATRFTLFPAGTFVFADVVRELERMSTPERKAESDSSMSFVVKDSTVALPERFTSDRELVRKLLDSGQEAAVRAIESRDRAAREGDRQGK